MSDQEEEQPRNRRSDDGFHVRKALDLGHIITTFVLAVGVLVSYFDTIADLNTRMALMEQALESQKQVSEDVRELRDAIGPLITKLDTYIDRKDIEDQRQWDRIRENNR